MGFLDAVVAAEIGRIGLLDSLTELIALRVLSIPNLIYNDFDLKIIKQKLAKGALSRAKIFSFININQLLGCMRFICYY